MCPSYYGECSAQPWLRLSPTIAACPMWRVGLSHIDVSVTTVRARAAAAE